MKCLYHRIDYDGICGAAIVAKRYKDVPTETEFIGTDYYDPIPDIEDGEIVILVDFTFPFGTMLDLNERCDLVWIDHHKTSIDAMGEDGAGITGLRDTRFAACELTWRYFFGSPSPLIVQYLGLYDIWDHSNPNTVPFQEGLRLEGHRDPLDPWWREAFEWVDATQLIEDGRKVIKYREQQDRIYMETHGFETSLCGVRALAVNRGFISTDTFKAVCAPERHPLLIGFSMQSSGRWRYSLRTETDWLDVGKLAKTFGGGGHPKSAGFELDGLILEVIK